MHLFSHPGLDLGHIVTDTPINETAEHGQRLCSDSRQIRLVSQIQYERNSALLYVKSYRIRILCPEITKLSEMGLCGSNIGVSPYVCWLQLSEH